MNFEKLLDELKDDLNNNMHEREAVPKFVKALNIPGLIYGGLTSIRGNEHKIRVSLINGRNTSIIIFYVHVKYIIKENKRKIISLQMVPLNYDISSYDALVDVVNRLKKQFLQKYKEDAETYLTLAKELKVSEEIALRLGEAFYYLNLNSKDLLLQKGDAYNLVYGKELVE